MLRNRVKVLETELVLEGGKVDDPNDPGGRTNQGVTQRVYSAYRSNKGLPVRSVYLMTDEERDDIYLNQYFAPVRFDELPDGLDALMVDGGVNSGPVQSIKWLQRALQPRYAGRVDGLFGEGTMAAVRGTNDVESLINAVADRRMAFLRANKNWIRYGRGWTSRVTQVKKLAAALALGTEHPDVAYTQHGNQKATIETAKQPPSAAPGTGVGSVGATAVVLTGYVTQIKSQLDSVLGTLPDASVAHAVLAHSTLLLANAGTWLTATGGVAAVAGAAWAAYAKWRGARLRDALELQGATGAPVTGTGSV